MTTAGSGVAASASATATRRSGRLRSSSTRSGCSSAHETSASPPLAQLPRRQFLVGRAHTLAEGSERHVVVDQRHAHRPRGPQSDQPWAQAQRSRLLIGLRVPLTRPQRPRQVDSCPRGGAPAPVESRNHEHIDNDPSGSVQGQRSAALALAVPEHVPASNSRRRRPPHPLSASTRRAPGLLHLHTVRSRHALLGTDDERNYGPEASGIVWIRGGGLRGLDQSDKTDQAERWHDTTATYVQRRARPQLRRRGASSPSGEQVPTPSGTSHTDMFAVPGDLASGTTYTTSSLRATIPGLGAVLVEKGRLVWGPDGDLTKEAGRHDLLDYFLGDSSALAGLCAALGA